MIKVSLATLVFIYIIGLGGTVLLFWFILEKFIDRRRTPPVENRTLIRCEICTNSFVDNSGSRYIQCPVCSTLLDRTRSFVNSEANGEKTS